MMWCPQSRQVVELDLRVVGRQRKFVGAGQRAAQPSSLRAFPPPDGATQLLFEVPVVRGNNDMDQFKPKHYRH